MEILCGTKLEVAIRKLLTNGERAEIAVAYWGKGATKRLLPPKRNSSNTLIVCDFMSGGCNPDEVKILIKRFGNLNRKKGSPYSGVGKVSKLHAKVWLTDKGAILGSSNASSNGIGEEGNELQGSIEANLQLDDRGTLSSIEQWWTDNITPEAISKRDIQRVIALRKESLRRRLPQSRSLLTALRENPEVFDNDKLFVWIWPHGKVDPETLVALQKESKDRSIKDLDWWVGASHLDPGSHVIHFNMENGKVIDVSLSKVLLEDEFIKVNSHWILLCKPARSFRELSLGDKKEWSEAAARAVKNRRPFLQMRASDFSRKFLRPQRGAIVK